MKIDEMEEALIRAEFRKLYNEIGPEEMMQVVYELTVSTTICLEILREELEKEKG